MADIQMVYIKGKCNLNQPGFCDYDCLTDRAEFTDCKCYRGQLVLRDDKGGVIKNLGGCCIHGQFVTKYKGWTGQRYDMEMIDDPDDPYNGCMLVRLGEMVYACTNVTLDGKCIHSETEVSEK